MGGVDVDLDRPLEPGDGEVESGGSVVGKVDPELTHQAEHARIGKRVGDADLGMGLGGAARKTPANLSEEHRCPRAARRDPVDCDLMEVGVGQVAVVNRLLDHRQEIRRTKPAREIEGRSGPRGDSDAVGTLDDVVRMEGRSAVGNHPVGGERVACRGSEYVNAVIRGEASKSPQPTGGRAGDGGVGMGKTDSGAAGHLIDGHAGGAIGRVEDSFDRTSGAQPLQLTECDAGGHQLIE